MGRLGFCARLGKKAEPRTFVQGQVDGRLSASALQATSFPSLRSLTPWEQGFCCQSTLPPLGIFPVISRVSMCPWSDWKANPTLMPLTLFPQIASEALIYQSFLLSPISSAVLFSTGSFSQAKWALMQMPYGLTSSLFLHTWVSNLIDEYMLCF